MATIQHSIKFVVTDTLSTCRYSNQFNNLDFIVKDDILLSWLYFMDIKTTV